MKVDRSRAPRRPRLRLARVVGAILPPDAVRSSMFTAPACRRAFGSSRRSLALLLGALAPAVAAAQRQAIRPPELVGPRPGPARLVLLARSSGSEAAVVPPEGLTIAVGCGPALDPASPELLRTRLDADGRVEVPFPWPELRARGEDGSRMWARVVEEGWQRSTRGFQAAARPEAQAVTLFPRRGWSVLGRLLDREGAPSEGSVRALRRGPEGDFVTAGHAFADARAQGRFELGLDGRDPVHLFARMATLTDGLDAILENVWPAEDLAGTAARLDVLPPGPAGGLELRARGPGVLRGRLLDPSGAPLPGIHLLARSSELALDPSRARRDELALRGAGADEATARTAADGSFEITGLREGSFAVHAGRSLPWLHRGQEVSSTPLPADGVRRDLVARLAPLLFVRVVDPDGAPWPAPVRGEPGPQRCFDPWFLDRSPDGPVRVRVAVDPSSSGEGRPSGEGIAPVPGSEADGGVAFQVEAGRRYLVLAESADGRWSLATVAVALDAARVEHVATVPDAAFGTLAVLPLDAAGGPVTDAEIRVEDLATGFPLLEPTHRLRAHRSQTLRLPAGRYRLVVQGSRPGSGFPPVLRARGHGAFETTVAIEAERETRVVARLGAGARLRVRLIGTASDRDRLALAEDVLAPSRGELESARARLVLSADGRWPAPVVFGNDDSPERVRPDLELGIAGLSEPQPAGRFTLTARLPGGRVVAAPVVLVDGVTTDVELVLE